MEITVEAIAKLVGGVVEGNQEAIISSFAKIQEGTEGTIAFLANPKYENYIYDTKATAVLVNDDFCPKTTLHTTLIRVPNAYTAISVLLAAYEEQTKGTKVGIESPSFQAETSSIGKRAYLGAFSYIGEGAVIGDGVKIYPHVYVGDNCVIGDNTTIHPGAKLYAGTKVGSHCEVHAGAVIGSDGFGFAKQADGTYKNVPQIGCVTLGDHVSIGANTTIDCATMGATIIGDGVKIDNLVQVAHNVVIGKNTAIAAQTGISGSAQIGENCVLAGQVGVVGHITIADDVTIGAQSGISNDIVQKGAKVIGSPAVDFNKQIRNYVVGRNLSELKKKIDALEKRHQTK